MNKKEFLSSISYEDKVVLSNIYDKIILSTRINKSVYLNEFYPPSIWKPLKNISHLLGCTISNYGIFEESDRRAISILGVNDIEDLTEYPVALIKIHNKSSFSNLIHSDFLGALMSLGVKREKFGDLIVEGNSCYLPVCSDISYYVKENLIKIGKSPCTVDILNIEESVIPKYKFEEKDIIVTSMRADCFISAICNMSRSACVDIINRGRVLVDYQKIDHKNHNINEGAIITVKGYGKFRVLETTGKTKKERCKVKIKKYI